MASPSATMSLFFFLGMSMLLNNSFAAADEVSVKVNYSDPGKWGSLSPQFALCSSGKHQSPIDILHAQTTVNKSLAPLSRDYYLDNATLLNTGLAIKVEVNGRSAFLVDGKEYSLVQIHWHTPSEHHLNGIRYAAELHEVHRAADGSLAVVAILYNYGKPDPLVAMIQPHLKALAEKECGEHGKDEIFLGNFDDRVLRKRPRKYYRYYGSLTTPPCSEPVTWTVMTKVKTMSKEQVSSMRSSLCSLNRHNNRPVQPLHDREVQLYDGN
ncbi:hypothetical protein Ancab_031624 [Ancistrocladus abbreviatus]